MLIAPKCHWTSSVFGHVVEPAVHVLGNGQSFVHHWSTLGDVALDLREALGDITSSLPVNPFAAVVVEHDGSDPTPVHALEHRAFAVATAPRAHRATLTFGPLPCSRSREPSANALHGT